MERRPAFVLAHNSCRDESVYHRSRYCLGVIELDLETLCRQPADAAKTIGKICKTSGIDYLVPAGLPPTILLSQIKNQLQGIKVFPVSPVELVRKLAHKLEFARILDRLKLPQPAYLEVQPGAPLPDLPFPYPVMVKPPDWDAGRGVKLCRTPEEAAQHLASLPQNAPALIQEFIPGYDLDISLLADRGRIVAWTIHKKASGKLGSSLASCRFVENETLLQIGRRLVEATEFTGLAHIDGRVDERDGSVTLIECNPRVYDSIHFAAFAGVNFIAAGLEQARQSSTDRLWRQLNGVVNTPFGALNLLLKRSEGIPIWTPGTRRAWNELLRDPLPWLLSFFGRRHRQYSAHQ